MLPLSMTLATSTKRWGSTLSQCLTYWSSSLQRRLCISRYCSFVCRMARALQKWTAWCTYHHWMTQRARGPNWSMTAGLLLQQSCCDSHLPTDWAPARGLILITSLSWLHWNSEQCTHRTSEVTTHVVSMATDDNSGVSLGANRRKEASGLKKLYCKILHHPLHRVKEKSQLSVGYSCIQLKTNWSESTTCQSQSDLNMRQKVYTNISFDYPKLTLTTTYEHTSRKYFEHK